MINPVSEPFLIFSFFSLHLFKNYGRLKKCVDMELTYFLECTALGETSLAQTGLSKTGFEDICRQNGKFSSSSNDFILKYVKNMITVNHIITLPTVVLTYRGREGRRVMQRTLVIMGARQRWSHRGPWSGPDMFGMLVTMGTRHARSGFQLGLNMPWRFQNL